MIYNKGVVYIRELILGTNAEVCPTGDQGTVKNETGQGGKGERQKEDMKKRRKNGEKSQETYMRQTIYGV